MLLILLLVSGSLVIGFAAGYGVRETISRRRRRRWAAAKSVPDAVAPSRLLPGEILSPRLADDGDRIQADRHPIEAP